jgi:type IX secretion system PorP/SprF family membrane protein
MARKKILFLILISFTSVGLFPQNGSDLIRISLAYPIHSQYLHNGLVINPAYAGSREALSFFASARQQWMGIKGAPRYETVSVHSLLKNDRVGLGFSGQFLQYGYTNSTSIYSYYAYHLNLGVAKLSFGLRAGFDLSNTNYANLTLIDPNDEAFKNNDKPYFLPNIGTGIYYYSKKFFFGAAIPSFLSYMKSSTGNVSLDTFKNFDVLVSAGALFYYSEAFKFKPSIFIHYSMDKSDKMRVDFNGNFIIKDFIWVGGSWRTTEKVVVGILQFQFTPQIMAGYSYDYPVGNLSTYSKGSHEVIFRYEFGYKVSADNPRYF